MTRDLSLVAEQIAADYPEQAIWVAFSGGVDSHVLLHLLALSERIDLSRLCAIHIDHGLQAESGQWAAHCQHVAAGLQVTFHCIRVDVKAIPQLGLEAAAREARYQAITEHVPAGSLVLTAQHQEDQAETLLLQLLRGSGVKGLSAMCVESVLAADQQLCRPLLGISQSTILAYAKRHKLDWIEDPSNRDLSLNRNYLRHTIWPSLLDRWPSAARSLSRSASYCAEADSLLSELAELDLAAMDADLTERRLSVTGVLSLSPARARNLIRYVVAELGLMMPSAVVLQRILDELCKAAEDKMPVIAWEGVEVRRFRDALYFLSPQIEQEANESYVCIEPETICLADGRQITWLVVEELGISKTQFKQGLRLGFRQGGESIRLAGHEQHKRLKHLYQEWAIPPWERGRIPLLFHGDELLVVIGYGLGESCVLADGEQGYLPIIKPA